MATSDQKIGGRGQSKWPYFGTMAKCKTQSAGGSTVVSMPETETTALPVTECPLNILVLLCYKAFHHFLCIPSIPVFKFDDKSQRFTYKRISALRKLAGFSLTCLAALYYAAGLQLERAQASNSTLKFMSTLLYMNCILLVLISPLTLSNSAGTVCEILNGVHALVVEMGKRGGRFPCRKHLRALSAASIASGAVLMAIYALVSMDGQHGWTLREGPGKFTSAVLNHNANLMRSLVGHNFTTKHGIDSEALNWTAGLAAATSFVYTWWVSVLWAGEYLMKVCWAAIFWILLDRFMELTENSPSPNLAKVSCPCGSFTTPST